MPACSRPRGTQRQRSGSHCSEKVLTQQPARLTPSPLCWPGRIGPSRSRALPEVQDASSLGTPRAPCQGQIRLPLRVFTQLQDGASLSQFVPGDLTGGAARPTSTILGCTAELRFVPPHLTSSTRARERCSSSSSSSSSAPCKPRREQLSPAPARSQPAAWTEGN